MRSRRAIVCALAVTAVVSARAGAQRLADEQSRREAVQFYRTGQEFMSAEKFDLAAEEFTKATGKDPLFPLAHYSLGQANMNQRRYASAIKAFQGCIESSRTLYGLAQTERFGVEKQRDDEINELRETIRRVRALGNAFELKAVQLEQHLQDLQNQKPSLDGGFRPPAEVLLALGSAYFRNGDLPAAEANWRSAVEANPKLGEGHNNLAVVFMMTGRYDDADAEIRAAEKAGFKVNPQLKADLKVRAKTQK